METEQNQSLLIVDDEDSILEVAQEYFEIKGYDVFIAQNGLEALEILETKKIDCCFTDINMPEMDGLDLAENIREKDNSIPVIIMTGYPSFENTLRTMKNGVVDFLIKPVDLNQMEICLKRVLRERQLFIENILLKKEMESKARIEELNRELLARVEELNTFNKIMTDFSMVSNSSHTLSRAIDMAVEITCADASGLYIFNDALEKPFKVVSSVGSPDNDKDAICSVAGAKESVAPAGEPGDLLIKDIASDRMPLLISQNKGVSGLPDDVRSFMAVPMKIREKVFGVLTASLTRNGKRFNEKDLYYLSFMTQNAAQALENIALYEHIYENLFSTLYAFVKALEARDTYTQQHSTRVTEIALVIGKEIGCSKEEIDILNFSGLLHDIGKLGIPDDILLKPGRLTREEFEKIKEHPDIGADIVGHLGLWDQEQQLIRCHHERFDGDGYPNGLKGLEIPQLSRILSVADAYDAMASDRAYRRKMPEEKIIAILKEGAGTQWDADIVHEFLKLHSRGDIKKIIDMPETL